MIPNLVESVKGAEKFEHDTMIEVTQARERVRQASAAPRVSPANDPDALKKFQAAQDQLSSALSHMMVVVEKYLDLKVTLRSLPKFSDTFARVDRRDLAIGIRDGIFAAIPLERAVIRTIPMIMKAAIIQEKRKRGRPRKTPEVISDQAAAYGITLPVG